MNTLAQLSELGHRFPWASPWDNRRYDPWKDGSHGRSSVSPLRLFIADSQLAGRASFFHGFR